MPGAKELIGEKNWNKWKDYTNMDLMGEGNNPIFPADPKRKLKASFGEVHHDNQTHASNYTILRKDHHTGKGYNNVLHDSEKSEIDHPHFKQYESPAILIQLTKVLEKTYGKWENVPNLLF